jgi:two-component sensor histidine kinase
MSAQIESVIHNPGFSNAPRAEADHRIANSLQLVSSLVRQRARSGRISNPQTFLMEIADRIETVGKLHVLLARSGSEEVQLASYLREICERLTGALAPEATSFALDCPADCRIPPKIALSLGLITAELVSNSLKYAHPAGLPTRITLSCSRDENGALRIIYEDDGVGFPEDFDISATGHMGLRLIHMLSKSIPGNHQWQSDALGVRFEMTVANIRRWTT